VQSSSSISSSFNSILAITAFRIWASLGRKAFRAQALPNVEILISFEFIYPIPDSKKQDPKDSGFKTRSPLRRRKFPCDAYIVIVSGFNGQTCRYFSSQNNFGYANIHQQEYEVN
jgi:hypothetical protein